jgi:hypothetical protein
MQNVTGVEVLWLTFAGRKQKGTAMLTLTCIGTELRAATVAYKGVVLTGRPAFYGRLEAK